jgi:hypothetical protein
LASVVLPMTHTTKGWIGVVPKLIHGLNLRLGKPFVPWLADGILSVYHPSNHTGPHRKL